MNSRTIILVKVQGNEIRGLEFQRKVVRKMLGMPGKEGTKFCGGEGEVENVSDSQQCGNIGKSFTHADSFHCSRLMKPELPSSLDTENLVNYLSRTTQMLTGATPYITHTHKKAMGPMIIKSIQISGLSKGGAWRRGECEDMTGGDGSN